MKLIKKWLGITKVEHMVEYLRKSMLDSYMIELSSIRRLEILESDVKNIYSAYTRLNKLDSDILNKLEELKDHCTDLQEQYLYIYNEIEKLKKGEL
jgi:hypothetical protein